MQIAYPGLCFVRSNRPGQINTDGVTTTISPSPDNGLMDPAGILIIPFAAARKFQRQPDGACVAIHRSINVPDHIHMPETFDGSQDLHGKKILIIMFNGWGDLILVQPTFHALFNTVAESGLPPEITLACGWVGNFPYPNPPYIADIRPNVIPFDSFCDFDVMINLTPLNHQRMNRTSMKDLYLEAFGISELKNNMPRPSLTPDPVRVERLLPVLNEIRLKTKKKLLCINWKARQPHKNASPELAGKIARRLSTRYHAVLFKDRVSAEEMEQEAKACEAPIQNLSHLIGDFHDTVAALSLVDGIISVDTGVVHAAGALGVPGVALFGPFPPETHVADYPSITGITADYQGKTCRGPCEETHKGCAETGFAQDRISPCFDAMDPDRVVDAFYRTQA